MITKDRCCVVIPNYKPFNRLDPNEVEVLYQISRVFAGREVYMIGPRSLDLTNYRSDRYIAFPDEFWSYSGYNKLCKSDFLYQTFLDRGFDYMCLVQLDVWVFQDNLDYFIGEFDKERYDYIGAPWYGVHFAKDGTVGNGGFCIRRLSKFRNVCRDYPQGGGNEDVYFLSVHRDKIRVAPERLALEFSFEEKPAYAYKLNNYKLPLGCHAYASTPDRLGFWRDYIYPIYEIKCKTGNPDIYNNPNHTVE